MSFNITDLRDVEKIVAILEEATNLDRKNYAIDDYKIYSGGQMDLLEKTLKREFPDSFDEMRPVEYNFCSKIVDKRSRIYTDGVKRTFLVKGEKDQKQQEVLSLVYKDMQADNVYKKANRFYELFNYLNIQLFIGKDNYLEMRAMPPFLFDIIPDLYGNPYVYVVTHYISTGAQRLTIDNVEEGDRLYTMWTKDNHVIVKSEVAYPKEADKEAIRTFEFVDIDGNPERINPLGELPNVVIKEDTDGFYYPMRNSTAWQCFTLCRMLSDVASIARTQGFGQATITCDQDTMPEAIKVGIKTVIKIPVKDGGSPGKFEYVTSGAPIQEQMNMVAENIGILLTTHALKPSEISVDLNATQPLNGISRLIESSELTDALDATKQLFVEAEREVFEKIIKYLELLKNTNQLPERYKEYKSVDTELRIDFEEAKPVQGEEDKLNMIERKVELGLITSWEKHIEYNPDLTEKEAMARQEVIEADKAVQFEKGQKFFQSQKEEDNGNENESEEENTTE